MGFVRAAEDRLAMPADSGAPDEVVDEIRARLEAIRRAWPALVPPERLGTDPSALYGAARRIEPATLSP